MSIRIGRWQWKGFWHVVKRHSHLQKAFIIFESRNSLFHCCRSKKKTQFFARFAIQVQYIYLWVQYILLYVFSTFTIPLEFKIQKISNKNLKKNTLISFLIKVPLAMNEMCIAECETKRLKNARRIVIFFSMYFYESESEHQQMYQVIVISSSNTMNISNISFGWDTNSNPLRNEKRFPIDRLMSTIN